MTVARLEREMGTRELAQWVAYDRYRSGRQQQAAAKARMVAQARGARERLGGAGP